MNATASALDVLGDGDAELLVEATLPEHVEPMLATLTDDRFSDPDWIYERKLDGERCLARVSDGDASLTSRGGNDHTPSYPDVADALAERVDSPALFDGEMVAFEGNRTSFQRLQPRIQVSDPDRARRSRIAVFYYVFDLMHVGKFDLRRLPLRSRKKVLRRLVDFGDKVRFATHRNEKGEAYFEEACSKGWEGLIAKDATASYKSGRSRSWLKFKCVNQQEFVIGGYTEPKGERVGLGAILIGFNHDGRFLYAGKVGTGFDSETLRELKERLGDLDRDDSPFEDDPGGDDVTYVEPRLVAEIGFTEWTDANLLRHPRYQGMRRDKDPGDVVREEPSS